MRIAAVSRVRKLGGALASIVIAATAASSSASNALKTTSRKMVLRISSGLENG
jgi:ABC-type transporter Mla maintaining outer membrane lipid asymmetry permease subunit MlaE